MINLALDLTLLQEGIHHYHQWNYTRQAHALVFGNTGSGKTHLCKLTLARIGLSIPNASVVLCDFKADDFKFLKGTPSYYAFTECTVGLERFYSEFQSRQSGDDTSRSFKLLFFDEWASYLNMLDKKAAEEAKSKLTTLLMLGRSFNFHILISQQRADAEYFSKARDNFGIVVALGNISKESAAMFNFDREQMAPVAGIGQGYMVVNGFQMNSIQVPAVRDYNKVESYIRKVVSKQQ